MNSRKVITVVFLGAAAMVISLGFPFGLTQAQSGHENDGQMNMMNMMDMGQSGTEKAQKDTTSLEKLHSESLPMVVKSIEKAISAIESGHNNDALAELRNAKSMIAKIDSVVREHITPKFVNNKCPIMGTTINPANVTGDLIREYKGQKVAFCCKMCPAQWDKLSDAEKEAKLATVRTDSPVQAENKM